MARLIQANMLISDHGDEGFRVFGRIHFELGGATWCLDVDEQIELKTGDPKINGQLEQLMLSYAERLHREEKSGYPNRQPSPNLTQ